MKKYLVLHFADGVLCHGALPSPEPRCLSSPSLGRASAGRVGVGRAQSVQAPTVGNEPVTLVELAMHGVFGRAALRLDHCQLNGLLGDVAVVHRGTITVMAEHVLGGKWIGAFFHHASALCLGSSIGCAAVGGLGFIRSGPVQLQDMTFEIVWAREPGATLGAVKGLGCKVRALATALRLAAIVSGMLALEFLFDSYQECLAIIQAMGNEVGKLLENGGLQLGFQEERIMTNGRVFQIVREGILEYHAEFQIKMLHRSIAISSHALTDF